MDNRFHPAMAAIESGDADRLRALLSEDATLATSRSSTSHPTLLQCLLLLRKGAQLNTIPGGFDYAGSGLHYAAFNGHRPMVEFLLEQGADVNLKDTKVGATPAGWADAGGHPEIADRLR